MHQTGCHRRHLYANLCKDAAEHWQNLRDQQKDNRQHDTEQGNRYRERTTDIIDHAILSGIVRRKRGQYVLQSSGLLSQRDHIGHVVGKSLGLPHSLRERHAFLCMRT